jgi:hypothetical protein
MKKEALSAAEMGPKGGTGGDGAAASKTVDSGVIMGHLCHEKEELPFIWRNVSIRALAGGKFSSNSLLVAKVNWKPSTRRCSLVFIQFLCLLFSQLQLKQRGEREGGGGGMWKTLKLELFSLWLLFSHLKYFSCALDGGAAVAAENGQQTPQEETADAAERVSVQY